MATATINGLIDEGATDSQLIDEGIADPNIIEVTDAPVPVKTSTIPMSPEKASERAGKVWDAARADNVPLEVADTWFYDVGLVASDPSSFAESYPDNRAGFSESFIRQWTGKGLVTKPPIAGGVLGMIVAGDTIASANRLVDPEFNYDAFNRRGELGAIMGGGKHARISRATDQGLVVQAIKDAEFAQRGKTFGGKVAAGVSQLPTWMIEFAATGGLASLGDDVVQRLGEKMVRKYATRAAGKAAIATAKLTTGAVIRTSTGLLPRVGEKATARQALIELGLQGEETWATSFAKAWGETFIESFTEQTGGTITKGLKAGFLKLPFGKKFVSVLQKDWIKFTGGTKETFWTKMLTKGGYSNIVGEIGEERLGTLLREATGVSDRGGNPFERIWEGMKEDLTLENMGAELVVLMGPSTLKRGLRMGASLTDDVTMPSGPEHIRTLVKHGVQAFATEDVAIDYAKRMQFIIDRTNLPAEVIRTNKKVIVRPRKTDDFAVIDDAMTREFHGEIDFEAMINTVAENTQDPDILRGIEEYRRAVEIGDRLAAVGIQHEVRDSIRRTFFFDAPAPFEGEPPSGERPGAIRDAVKQYDDGKITFAEMVNKIQTNTENPELLREITSYREALKAKELDVIPEFIESNIRASELFVREVLNRDYRTPREKVRVSDAEIQGAVKNTKALLKHLGDKGALKTSPEERAEQGRKQRAARERMAGLLIKHERGVSVDEIIFEMMGFPRNILDDYPPEAQVRNSIDNVITNKHRNALYAAIYNKAGLDYHGVTTTALSLKKFLTGIRLTQQDIKRIELVFGKEFRGDTKVLAATSTFYEKAVTVWRAGLLTGLKTSNLNMMANMMHAVTETAASVPASLMDSIIALKTGKRTTAITFRGTIKGIKEGTIKAVRYMKTGVDERNIAEKLDYTAVNFGDSKLAKALQIYEETIFHLMGAEDQPFYYRAKAVSLASQAIAQSKAMPKADRRAFVEDLIKNPTDKMLEYAVHDAEMAVFQNKTLLGDVAKAIQKAPGGEIVVPFGRTPSAVATQIINYTPVGVVAEVIKIIEGKGDQRRFSQAMGRMTVGTGALFLGGALFTADMITLGFPKDERERKLWELEGRKPNSIKIDGKWRSIQVLGPAGNVLLIGGYFQQEYSKSGSPTEAMINALKGGGQTFSEQTFVRGVNAAVDAFAMPDRSFERWFGQMAGSIVPTLVADVAAATDDVSRKAVGVERFMARVPGVRKKLPARMDVFGQDLPRYGGDIREVMLDPSRPVKIRQNIVVDELRQLSDGGINVTPTDLAPRAGYDILTVEENADLQRRTGRWIYAVLFDMVNSEGWKAVDDFQKGKLIQAVTGKIQQATRSEMARIKIKEGADPLKLAEEGFIYIEKLDELLYYTR